MILRPEFGPVECHTFESFDEFLIAWRTVAPKYQQVIAVRGVRFVTTKPPVHLLAEGGRYPLIEPEELLLDADPYGFTSHDAAEELEVVEPVPVEHDDYKATTKPFPGSSTGILLGEDDSDLPSL